MTRLGRIAIGVVLATTQSSDGLAQVRFEQDGEALRRIEYFLAPRRYPFDRVPPAALQTAWRQVDGRFGLSARASARRFQRGLATSWAEIGPGTINGGSAAGRVTALAVHPVNGNTLYAAGAQGGVWKTTNGGTSWTALTETQCSLAVGSLAIDPVNPLIVYAGTGEQNNSADSYYGCGVLRSADGGESWAQLGASTFVTPTGGGARIGHLLIDRASAGSLATTTLLASSSFGLHRSTDSGQSWTRVLAGNVSGLAADATNPQIVYAAIGNYGTTATQNGIFKSADGGASWAQLPFVVPSGVTLGRIELAVAPSNPQVVYAGIEDRTNGATSRQLLGIYRSVDGGTTWAKMVGAGASCASQCWYDLSIAVDPVNADRVYMGGLFFYRSDDGGNVFTNLGSSIHVDHHAIAFAPSDPATIYVGSDGGVYRSTNRGLNWSTLNSNLAVTQFYRGISLHPSDPSIVLGGTQDNGVLEFTGIPNWRGVVGGDGGFTAINYEDPAIAFATIQWTQGSSSSGPRRRDVGNGTFRSRIAGIEVGDRAQFIPPMVMDPVNPRVLYFGTFRLYRTADNAETWTAISQDLSKTGTGTVTAIATAASDTQTVYVGMNDGNVKITRDLGATWTTIISGLPNRAISDIAVDPTNPLRAWLVVSGFSTDHIFRTDNAGQSWVSINGDFGNVPVNAIVALPRSLDLFIGTDLGVFRSPNGGVSWVPVMEGFPNVAVFDLVFNDRTRTLVAATHGRGMFSLAIPAQVLRGDVTGDGKITTADAQAVLMAAVGLSLPIGMTPYPNGDANCDGVTTALDAQIILSFVVGEGTDRFCVGTVR